jgi:hypothetical protein
MTNLESYEGQNDALNDFGSENIGPEEYKFDKTNKIINDSEKTELEDNKRFVQECVSLVKSAFPTIPEHIDGIVNIRNKQGNFVDLTED